jgi:hypothetical protein
MMRNVRLTRIGGRLGGPVGAVLVWAVTRAVLMLFVFQVVRFPGQIVVHDVETVYEHWYPVLRAGGFPSHDVTWQYPPGAAAVLVAPGAIPFLGYAAAFYWLALLTDALVLVALLAAARRPKDARSPKDARDPAGAGDTPDTPRVPDTPDAPHRPAGQGVAGAWVWVLGVAVAGPVVFARYDVMVTAVGVLALLRLRRGPRLAGALAGAGAMLKVWPALLLIGTPKGTVTRRAWWWAAVVVAAVSTAFAALTTGAFSFLAFQRDRGTEVESLGAMVFHLARHAGWHGRATMHYGSVEFLGRHVHAVSWAALALSVLAFCWLLLWRVRATVFTAATPYDAAFTAVLVFTTTSRVISPQYMVWLIGIGAVCGTVRGTAMRLPVLVTLAATLMTTLEFPVFFAHVVASDRWGVLLLGSRNGLLVAASLIACRRLWAVSVRGETAGPRPRPRPAPATAAPPVGPAPVSRR